MSPMSCSVRIGKKTYNFANIDCFPSMRSFRQVTFFDDLNFETKEKIELIVVINNYYLLFEYDFVDLIMCLFFN